MLTFVREPRKILVILSLEEIARLLEAAPGPKYKAALSAAYPLPPGGGSPPGCHGIGAIGKPDLVQPLRDPPRFSRPEFCKYGFCKYFEHRSPVFLVASQPSAATFAATLSSFSIWHACR
jgi:hypothetical protein